MTNLTEPEYITMHQHLYDLFDHTVSQTQGMPFENLAQDWPTDAYRLLDYLIVTAMFNSDLSSITSTNPTM